jgi:hypothetical protein
MKLSIIIPNYNGSKTIEKCIDSVYAQKIEIEELIMVDDASTDNSVRLVKEKFPKVHIIEHGKNYGAAKARNDGIKNSKGNLLLFVDSDVYLSNSCIEEMLKYINEFDIVYPTVFFENGDVLSPASSNEKAYIRRSPVFLMKKEALSKLDEFFDEGYFIYYEDVDFFTRCYLAGLKSKYVPESVAYHIITFDSRDLERRFYLETKNRIYCVIKFSGISESTKRLLLIPKLGYLLVALRIAFSNKNIYSNYPDHAGEDKLSDSRVKLIYLLFKAILWNILNLRESLRKRKVIGENYGGNR